MKDTLINIGQVLGVNGAAIGITSMTNLQDWLKVLGLILAAVYTSIKIYNEVKTNA